jgi:hypothetical protein
MAVCSVSLGGLVGFFTSLCAYFFFEISFLMALVLYAAVGSILSICLITLSLAGGEVCRAIQRYRTPPRKVGQAHAMTTNAQN